MNVRLDDKGPVLSTTAACDLPKLAVSKGQLTTTDPGPGPVYQSGPYKNLYVRDIAALGLDKINWIGITPVTANPPKDRKFVRACGTAITRGIMSQWYQGRPEAHSHGLEGPFSGPILVICGPHTGVDDPAWVYSKLYPFLKIRPVATEGTFTQPFVKRAMRVMRGLPVPDTSNLVGTSDEMKLLVAQGAACLRNGEPLGIHLAGEILLDNIERIGSNSLAHMLLELVPETRVITATTRGMNGTEFSRAGNDGQAPDIGKAARAHFDDAVYNWKHLRRTSKEKVDAPIELRDVTEQVKAQKAVRDQNAIFAALANQPDPITGVPNQPWRTPRRFDDPRSREPFAPPVRPQADLTGEVDESQVPAITDKVLQHLESLGIAPEKIKPKAKLAELGLDSLAVTSQVLLWVNSEFRKDKDAFTSPEAFITVADVINGATGRMKPTAGIEFKPVSAAYAAQIERTDAATIAPDATNVVDGFLKLVRSDPNCIVQIDEIQGEVTARELARLVSLLIPEVEKLPGKYVPMMFANSVIGKALELAIPLAGKTPAMLNVQWGDKATKGAMEHVEGEVILSAQRVIRGLKGLRELADKEAIEEGRKTAEEVAADPTRTNFPSVENRLVTIDDTMRNLSELAAAIKTTFPNKMLRELEARAQRIKPSDEAVVIYTTGSTGIPKAVAYTHEQVLYQCRVLAERFDLSKGDSLLQLPPGFHLVGYMASMMATLTGVATVNVANPKVAAVAVKQGQRRKCTITAGTSSLLSLLAQAGALPTIKRAISGAEELKPEQVANIRKSMPHAKLLQGFGATETGITFLEEFDPGDTGKRTLGTALKGLDYLLVDEDDPTKIVPRGCRGQLLARGPTVVSPERGYVGGAPDDADAFVFIDGKAYFNTGDVVQPHDIVDEDGKSHKVIEFLWRNQIGKVNGERISLGGLANDIKGLLPKSIGGLLVVQGPTTPAGADTLVAYLVPGRDENGKPIMRMRDDSELTYAKVRQGLKKIHTDGKFSVAEIRVLDQFTLAGTGKTDLGYYRQAGTMPHVGTVLR